MFNADGATAPKVLERAEFASEQLKALVADPDLQRYSKGFSDQMEAVLTTPEFQQQAKYALEELHSIMEDPVLSENVNRFAEHGSALATQLIEFAAGGLEGQDVGEHAELASEQLKAIVRDPLFQKGSKLFAERM